MNSLTRPKKLSSKLRKCLYFLFLALLLCTCTEMKEHCGDYVSLATGGQCPPEPRTTYTLTVNRNPAAGGTVSPSGTSTRNAGMSVTVTATAAEGYTFTGWTGAPSGVNSSSNSVTFNINSNVTMTANFALNTPTTYTLTVDRNPTAGGTVSPSGTSTRNAGTSVTVTATAAEGYTFTGWTGAPSGVNSSSNSVTFNINSNVTMTANFAQETPTTHTLTVDRNPTAGGTVSPSGTSTRNAGTSVTVTATAAEGYTFTGWTGAPAGVNSSSNSVTFNINSNVTMTANFTQNAPNTHTLTVTAGAGGTTNPSGVSQHASGSVVSITATPSNANCTFTDWSGDLSGTANPASVTMNGNRTITANFNCGGGGEEGLFTDPRDDRVYHTVRIGSQTWMAENLNYNASGSVCYNNSPDSCAKYGRLYDWNTVMGGSASSSSSPSGVRGICPVGWHVPSDAEWTTLTNFVGSNAGTKLKSATGWSGGGNGTDDFGFSALPGGGEWSGAFSSAGDNGGWWSATEGGAGNAWFRVMYWSYSNVSWNTYVKTGLFSVRCLRDD